MIDIKEHLVENREKQKEILTHLKQIKNEEQELLQELLRLDGEHRLLQELEKMQAEEKEGGHHD